MLSGCIEKVCRSSKCTDRKVMNGSTVNDQPVTLNIMIMLA